MTPGWQNPQFWTEARVLLLKKLHLEGVTFTGIAFELGCTRNAAIGKARRVGLEREKPERIHNPNSNLPNRRYTRAPWVVPGLLANGKKIKSKLEHALLTDLPPEEVPNPVKLLDLEKHHCRWPVHPFGEPALFCGGDALKGYPYCGHHCRMAYTRTATLNRAEQEIIQRKMRAARNGIGKVAA